jgi:hypothetical protein
MNISARTYVAYIFAHNAGGFGLTSADNVVTCDSLTTNGSGVFSVNLGYEPQWVLLKKANAGTAGNSNWFLLDNMRGWSNTNQVYLYPNLTDAEYNQSGSYVVPTSTGFQSIQTGVLDSSSTYIYIAIRRGPMKTPTTGTSVFSPVAYTGNGSTRSYSVGFPTDLSINMTRSFAGDAPTWNDRLRGSGKDLYSSATQVEYSAGSAGVQFDNNTNIIVPNYRIINGDTYIDWCMRRAPGFFDEVCYTGNGTASTQITHNLGVAPELIICKSRSGSFLWNVYSSAIGTDGYLKLNTTDAVVTGVKGIVFDDPVPSATTFSIGFANQINQSGATYVAYLFATCAGVSKVGSYTGTGTTLQVNCGFTNGSRFVLIKRSDSTGDWYVWDSARGIVAGNDPYLLLNSTAAEVTNTDYVDTYSAGFEISSTAPAAINANGGTFIFLAIA